MLIVQDMKICQTLFFNQIQTDTYVSELVEIFLKLSMKTVQVHSVTWMALVSVLLSY